MRKIIIVLLSVIILSACTKSKTEIQNDIAKTYEGITFSQILESLTEYGIVLNYDEQLGSINMYKQKHYIHLNENLTYIYSNDTKIIQKYTTLLDDEFQSYAEDVYEFMDKIEQIENIEFRKFDYLIYDVIAAVILDTNQGYLNYTSRLNPVVIYHPSIIIKNEYFNEFYKLNDILSQLEPDLTIVPEIKISLSTELTTSVHLHIGSKTFSIKRSMNEDYAKRVVMIDLLLEN